MDDVIVEGLNMSALGRNFDKLQKMVERQGEVIEAQKKKLQLYTSKMQALQKQVYKEAQYSSELIKDLTEFD